MITGRSRLAGAGTNTVALAFGGQGPSGAVDCTESFSLGIQTCIFTGTIVPPPYEGV